MGPINIYILSLVITCPAYKSGPPIRPPPSPHTAQYHMRRTNFSNYHPPTPNQHLKHKMLIERFSFQYTVLHSEFWRLCGRCCEGSNLGPLHPWTGAWTQWHWNDDDDISSNRGNFWDIFISYLILYTVHCACHFYFILKVHTNFE